MSTRGSTLASSPTLTNTEQRSQPVAQDVVIKPSQVQNKNTNSDNVLTQPIDGGATPSLLRRKRALPNLGSGARKRRSSVSKENVDKNPDVPEVGQEEEIVSHKDLGHSNVSCYFTQMHAVLLRDKQTKFMLERVKKAVQCVLSLRFECILNLS